MSSRRGRNDSPVEESWQTAIGLQAVDGLTTSPYLLETAREHIEGRIDIGEAQRRIRSYYDEREGHEEIEGEQEADIVSSRITELLGERAFTLSPVELCDIHRRLFDQVLPRASTRANYEDVTSGISPEMVYPERFFENLLCGARHELRNRYLHLDWPQRKEAQETQPADQVTQQVTTSTPR